MSFSLKNDKRSNNLISQNILTNTLTATTITAKNLNSSGSLIINTSDVIINASNFVVNTEEFCANASGQFKAAADTILLESTGALTISASTVISNGLSGNIVLKGPIVSGFLSFAAQPNSVNLSGVVSYQYQRIGDTVHLRASQLSPSTSVLISAYVTSQFIPLELRPIADSYYGISVVNNSALASGWVFVRNDGTLQIGLPPTGFFDGTGTAGFNGFEITWFIANP